MSHDVEVCVVGGGPAGATLAARLAQLGHDVAIVEQQRFPRAHVGESLSPAVWPLLDLLGLRDVVEQAGFTATATARVRWRDDHVERVRLPGGLTVDRGRFDAILLQCARAAGARVLEPGHARPPVAHGDRWDLPVGGGVVRARFVADATGRRRMLGGRQVTTGPRTLALHAVWSREPAPDDAQTRIDAIAEGWLWGARLPDGTFRAMAFVDPQTLLADGRDKRRLYDRLLAASGLFAELPSSDGARAGPVQACDATTYAVASAIDERSVRVGEAAFAIDPLSSSGVQTAMQTGLAAATAAHGILAGDGDPGAAIEYYADQVSHAAQHHAMTAAALYAEHSPHADAPFWRRRSAPSVAPPRRRAPRPLSDLLAVAVRLAPVAALRSTPCLVGDRIERRRALTHPALDRPVAFLGGDELAPLIDILQAAPTLAAAIGSWDRVLEPGRASAVAGWLHARGLLVADGACG